jgi:hypothetical protein
MHRAPAAHTKSANESKTYGKTAGSPRRPLDNCLLMKAAKTAKSTAFSFAAETPAKEKDSHSTYSQTYALSQLRRLTIHIIKCDCDLACTREGLFFLSAASAEREKSLLCVLCALAVNATIKFRYDIVFQDTCTSGIILKSGFRPPAPIMALSRFQYLFGRGKNPSRMSWLLFSPLRRGGSWYTIHWQGNIPERKKYLS